MPGHFPAHPLDGTTEVSMFAIGRGSFAPPGAGVYHRKNAVPGIVFPLRACGMPLSWEIEIGPEQPPAPVEWEEMNFERPFSVYL